jgi:large subunit ribosomal protein L4
MSIVVDKVDAKGSQVGKFELEDSVFGIEPNTHVLYLALKRELANARAGTANSKTRNEVRGGGKKPWKQKGTGRARAGSTRSPLWVGGGVIFGPKPRDFSIRLNKAVRRLALRSALSSSSSKIKVVSDFSFLKTPKTSALATFLKTVAPAETKAIKKILILADYKASENQNLLLSARNIPGVKLSLPHNLSVKDLLHVDAVITTDAAVQEITGRYQSNG